MSDRNVVEIYLREFFGELEKVKPRRRSEPSHAITLRDGMLFALVSIGDFRERVRIDALDTDPAKAARQVAADWKTGDHADEDVE